MFRTTKISLLSLAPLEASPVRSKSRWAAPTLSARTSNGASHDGWLARFRYGLLTGLVLIAFLAGSTAAQLHLTGDLNGDQRVDFKDLRILAQQWLDPWCVVSDCVSDLDGVDGVNFLDYAVLAGNWQQGQKVVINEIHYDPDVKTELVEFVELYNAGTMDANLAGWYFSDGISYKFPPGSILPAGGYIIVAQDPGAVQTKFGTPSNLLFGPFVGKLENDGEKVELCNAEGITIDEVDYRRRFPWPIVGDPPGYSIELVNPSLDNDLGGSWRPSEPDSIAPPTTLLAEGATFSYFKGFSEASSPMEAWRKFDFNDLDWPTGQLPIGYGEPDYVVTDLPDMRYNYTCVFLRKKFDVSNPGAVGHLWLDTVYDDGWNAWINGKFVKGANMSDVNLPYTATAGNALEDHSWNQFVLPAPSGYIETENVLAIQLFNSSIGSSSDCFLDVRLVNRPATSSASPTPAQRNTTYSANIPPHMRQIKHYPKQPGSGEDVKITVKVTDSDGVQSVVLSYQPVYPGSYIEIDDPEYETNWTSLPMADDGNLPDEEASDDIYTVKLPGALNTNRLLMRYRITATDNTDLSVTGPYAHDPQPNFAYFVYNGVPGWSGAIEPNSIDPIRKQVIYYDPAALTRVPVYYLITKKDSVMHSTWFDKYGGDLYKWKGTLVYDGEVYDHIRYRARGGVWRYAMGKNMWKFDFNRGHFFEARDDYGKKYDTTWDKLNFSACIQQGSFGQRGEQGMFEALSFGMFNLAEVPAPKTHWVHYRIIDEAAEFGQTQYEGDFWGLYMVIEQMDGRFLDEHGLPDGNLYKMEARYGELNNQGLTAVTDGSDIRPFKDTYETSPPAQWWGENVNLDCYYSYRAVYLAAHHGDITSKNHFFYLNPELTTNEWGTHYLWWQLPWDVDLTWTTYYGGMSDPFSRAGILSVSSSILNIAAKNRIREFCDLFFNSEQVIGYIDELAAIINPISGSSIVDADRAMWDYHWVMQDNAYPTYLSHQASFKAGTGRFYEEAEQRGHSRSFSGMVQVMKGYVVNERESYMNSMAADSSIPYTPTVTSTGPAGYPINALTFATIPFNDPQGSGTFTAMKWRIAEVTDVTCPAYDPLKRRRYEIEAVWDSGEITDFNNTITIPASVVKVGHAYRVRVRMKDNTNRWSHWSSHIHFIVGEPTSAHILDDLRITEVMYNPADPPPGDPYGSDDFEFIELKNTGPETLDLTYVSFADGITFDFNDSSVTSLDPCDFVLVVKDQAAFESRYGTGLSDKIAGEYKYNVQNSLKNGGEYVKLVDVWHGTIVEFEYEDGRENGERAWPLAADGIGHSLVPLDSALPGEPGGTLNYGGNWRRSTYIHGSPGQDDPPLTTVVLNEIMAHTDYSVPPHDSNDWIELYNTTDSPITLNNNWYLSDDIDNLKKWAIPSIEIGAYGRVSFDEVTGFHQNPFSLEGFGLNEAGEEVVLSYLPGGSNDRVVDCIRFEGQESDISLGRWPDGGAYWFHMTLSRDVANTDPHQPVVVIDEIMYHPAIGIGQEYDYIELYNPTASQINLENATDTWRLKGVDYQFPTGISISAGDRLIVVAFDPSDPVKLSAFETAYSTGSLVPDVDIVGPWLGTLSNSGDRLALEEPQPQDSPTDPISWVIVDEVIYDDYSPWPETPDGTGDALQRINSDQYHSGNDPENWKADIPSPGEPN